MNPDLPAVDAALGDVRRSRDPAIVSLAGLLELKMRAGRHRDVADAVELLKRLDEAHYIEAEASVSASLRPHLAELRRDALDELACE